MDAQEFDYSFGRSHRELYPMLNWTDSNYTPTEYVAPGAIEQTHNQPRWGHTNNLGALIDANSEETAQDYVLGVIIGAMVILIVALVWFFAIAILKIMGEKKVGFLAGRLVRPVDLNNLPDTTDEKGGVEVVMKNEGEERPLNKEAGTESEVGEAIAVTNNNNEFSPAEKIFNRKVWAVRIMFVLSGILVMISGGLFYGKGVVSFKNSIDEVRFGLDLVQVAALKGITLTDDLLKDKEEINEELEPTQQTVDEKGQICGLDTELSTQIRSVYDEFVTSVDELTNMLDGTLEDFSSDLRSLISLTESIDDSLDSADIVFYVLIAISIVLICIIMAMIASVILVWRGYDNCFTRCIKNAFIWPLFVFFLVMSWIFATLFLVLSLGGADFCISPDEHVQTLLSQREDQFEGIIFSFIVYYVSGCKIEPADDQINELMDQIRVVVRGAHQMTDALGQTSVESLTVLCGLTVEQATALKDLVNVAHEATHVLNRGAVGLRDLLACDTFNPIYNTFVHEAFCVQGVSGLTYIFSTTLIISIFSMIMIMFRAALYPVKEPPAASKSKSEDVIEAVQFNDNENENDKTNAPAGADDGVGEEDKPVIY